MFAISAGGGQVVNIRSKQKNAQDFPASVAVIIPSWKPDGRLLAVVSDLRSRGVQHLIVVDDGSGPEFHEFFADLTRRFGVTLCCHAENHGKGRALKTAFEYVLDAHPELLGVVTADADGQHPAEDIARVARALVDGGNRAVLGTRSFTGDVPWRSRFGNRLARRLFAVLGGCLLRDTQTGLRGVPASLLPDLVTLHGERYDFEMVMLAYLCRTGKAPEQVPIRTVYLDGNRGSHFHPVWDSFRVYKALLRCSLSRYQDRTPRLEAPKKQLLHTA